jgi:hypothetical protein
VQQLERNAGQFAIKHPEYQKVTNLPIDGALVKAEAEQDMRKSAQLFGQEIGNLLRSLGTKNPGSTDAWSDRLASFLSKLYPLAKLSLSLTGAIAGAGFVYVYYHERALLIVEGMPLQGATAGLGIILQERIPCFLDLTVR